MLTNHHRGEHNAGFHSKLYEHNYNFFLKAAILNLCQTKIDVYEEMLT